MNNPCGCYHGGDCTKTTVCAFDSVKEEFEDRIEKLEARLDAVKNCPAHETTGCDSSGETFAVVYLLKDDVLAALGGDDD